LRAHRSLLLIGALLAVLLVPAGANASITGRVLINPHPSTSAFAAPSAPTVGHAAENPFAPVVGASWAGLSDPTVAPPDTNGAIGPSNYLEIINLQLGIYTRSGVLVNESPLGVVTGHSQFNLSDPMVLWDSATQRFYYNVWDTAQATMVFGFSKTSTPASPADFCSYTKSFGYASTEAPDYPKLGQSTNFLLIGVNHYASFSASSSDRSDLLWISKPKGSAAISSCPAATTFNSGRFANLRNSNGTQAFTPVPAIEDDALGNGYVVASNDIECPPTCGSGNLVTVYTIRQSSPGVASIFNTKSITVPSYSPPPGGAPQKGTSNLLDTLDGRLEHAVVAFNPAVGHPVIWTGQTINGGGRSVFRWYEISPLPIGSPTVVASGTVSDPSLWVFNGAMAPDRAVPSPGVPDRAAVSSFGGSYVIGFSTSSSTTLPAAQMVSSVSGAAQSPFVMVHQSTSADNDFSCSPTCRWGDYGGATSDPAATGAHGEVWLTNEAVTAGNNTTWNWEAKP
jgi:hypothetical protein